jgi:enoyl-CoA hydratase/carnithine racemase
VQEVTIEKRGHITVITLNRADKHNAINERMRELLARAVQDFNSDDDQYVAVVTGAGSRSFCAGFDLVEMAQASGAARRTGPTSTDLFGLGSSAKPIIAAVNGFAVAGGLEVCLNCDIRIAAQGAWFGAFEAQRGLMAGIASNLLPRLVSPGDAMFLLLATERITSDEALRMGLVQRVVPDGMVLDEALRIAEAICANSQVAVQASKRVVRFWQEFAMRETFEHFSAVNRLLMLSDDVREGPRAFAEKRAPQFSNRWPLPR